jgi:hypothetical protein
MDNNLKLILEEFEQLKGQFIITMSHTIERLVAIGTDDEDWYWITWTGKELHWSSCVGKIIPLKGYLRDDDYNDFLNCAKLNHVDYTLSVSEFSTFVKLYISNYPEDHKFLTDFCWNLN